MNRGMLKFRYPFFLHWASPLYQKIAHSLLSPSLSSIAFLLVQQKSLPLLSSIPFHLRRGSFTIQLPIKRMIYTFTSLRCTGNLLVGVTSGVYLAAAVHVVVLLLTLRDLKGRTMGSNGMYDMTWWDVMRRTLGRVPCALTELSLVFLPNISLFLPCHPIVN